MRVFPSTLNEDVSFVCGLPLGVLGAIIVANVTKLVHLSHHRGTRENVHLTVVENLDFLVFNELVVVQVIVINIYLIFEIGDLSLLDLNEREFAVPVEDVVLSLVVAMD